MNDFATNQNKELLWNLLLNNGAFNNLLETQLPAVQTDFEKLMVSLSNEKTRVN